MNETHLGLPLDDQTMPLQTSWMIAHSYTNSSRLDSFDRSIYLKSLTMQNWISLKTLKVRLFQCVQIFIRMIYLWRTLKLSYDPPSKVWVSNWAQVRFWLLIRHLSQKPYNDCYALIFNNTGKEKKDHYGPARHKQLKKETE